VINPSASHFTRTTIKPFFCAGSIAYATLRAGGSVHVMPRGSTEVHEWLNSRFEAYTGDGCAPGGAPPDSNVREFVGSNVTWMTTTLPAAQPLPATSPRMTIADPATVPANVRAGDYGPLWVYNKPAKYVSATTGAGASPTFFAIGNWTALYQTTAAPAMTNPTTLTYPDPPYTQRVTAASGTLKFAGRRLLNLPLLDCATAGATATVLGIGRFYMTSKATAASVYGEFAGLASESSMVANVKRLQ
jgi:hypothetical protein